MGEDYYQALFVVLIIVKVSGEVTYPDQGEVRAFDDEMQCSYDPCKNGCRFAHCVGYTGHADLAACHLGCLVTVMELAYSHVYSLHSYIHTQLNYLFLVLRAQYLVLREYLVLRAQYLVLKKQYLVLREQYRHTIKDKNHLD